MALLFVESFDHYTVSGAGSPPLLSKWGFTPGTTGINTTLGRRGGGMCILNGYTQYIRKTELNNMTTVIVGGAFQTEITRTYSSQNTSAMFAFLDAGVYQLYIKGGPTVVSGDQSVQVVRGDGTVLGESVTLPLVSQEWQYIEAKVVIDATVGSVEVRVAEQTVLLLENIDTTNGSSVCNEIQCGIGNGVKTYLDDIYMCDDTTAINNDFLGDVQIEARFPTSDGFYTDFTPSAGIDHYANVDENPQNTTDYNEGLALNEIDTYGFTAPTQLGPMLGVQVTSYKQNPDAGLRKTKHVVRSNGVDYLGAEERTLNNTWILSSDCWGADPGDDNPWTEAKINAAEFGIKVTV